MQNQNQRQNQHQPVLLEAVLRLLAPQPQERYLDITAGYGGHADAIIAATGPSSSGEHILIDRDAEAIGQLKQRFRGTATREHGAYTEIVPRLEGRFDLVLADLGISSPQLDNDNRGFSFRSQADLDMRMDQHQDITAADIINRYSERELADLIYRYGEERQSRRIARAIVSRRPLHTTDELANVVAGAYRGKSRIHPATRTFQALRIAVNDELGQLERVLPMIESLLAPGGRVGIISFHSLEDRLVKQFFRRSSLEPQHKNVVQGRYEDVSNPRARSAKLRVAMKNKNGHAAAGSDPEADKTNRR